MIFFTKVSLEKIAEENVMKAPSGDKGSTDQIEAYSSTYQRQLIILRFWCEIWIPLHIFYLYEYQNAYIPVEGVVAGALKKNPRHFINH